MQQMGRVRLIHYTMQLWARYGYCDAIEVSTVSLQRMMFFPLCRRRDDPESGYLFADKVRTLQLFAGNPCEVRTSGEIMNLRYSYGGCERGKMRYSHTRKNNVSHPCEHNIFRGGGSFCCLLQHDLVGFACSSGPGVSRMGARV